MCVTIITTDTLLYQKKVIRIARSALKAANRRILIDACCTGRTASTESTFNEEIEDKHFVKHFLTINYESSPYLQYLFFDIVMIVWSEL